MIRRGNKKSYWIEIINDRLNQIDNGDGKWVVLFTSDFHKIRFGTDTAFLNKIDKIINEYNLKGALISKSFFDELIIFTSADRIEIHQVKEIIIRELNVSETKLIWKAIFETDDDWNNKYGKRHILNEIITNYEKKNELTKQKRYVKADRIFVKEIHPKIHLFSKILLEEDVKNRKSMVITPSFPTIDYNIDKNMVFVLMPFNEDFSEDIFHLIKKAGIETKFNVLRADDIFSPDIIINDIWSHINKASLIIADITVHNANVFYELGIAHTLGKKVVLLRKSTGEKTPFDIAFWRYFEYDTSAKKADEFLETIKKIFIKHRELIAS